VLGTIGLACGKALSECWELNVPRGAGSWRAKEREEQDFTAPTRLTRSGSYPPGWLDVVGGKPPAGTSLLSIVSGTTFRDPGRGRVAARGVRGSIASLGKGRQWLLALGIAFKKKIVGCRFSSALHQAAEQNVRTSAVARQRCRSIERVVRYANGYFPIPPEPLVSTPSTRFKGERDHGVGFTPTCGARGRSTTRHRVVYSNPAASGAVGSGRLRSQYRLGQETARFTRKTAGGVG